MQRPLSIHAVTMTFNL